MDYVYIGKIVNTHGIKGEVRILSNFEMIPKVFQKGMTFYIGKKKEAKIVTSYRHHKVFEMVTFEGIDNINDVLYMKGLNVFVNWEDLNLQPGEYLDQDLIGFHIYMDGEEKGTITEIRESAKNHKLFIVKTKEKKVYAPYERELLEKVDLVNKRIDYAKIEGLFQ